MLTVYFGKTKVSGQRLRPENTRIQPSINIVGQKTKYYTILVSDTETRTGDFLHWLVVNINKERYRELLAYIPPKPSTYTIYLLEQEHLLDIEPMSRSGFDINIFIKDNDLIPKYTLSFTVKA
jgi:hypothetical protein